MGNGVDEMAETRLVVQERIREAIVVLRGHRVMLDADLSVLYQVETKALVRAVKRNRARFPADVMFQLTDDELEILRRQFGTSSGWGGRRHLPYAFTEQGVAMLSSVLHSPRAVQVNIEIMRAFVRIRQMVKSNAALAKRLAGLGQNGPCSRLTCKHSLMASRTFTIASALVRPWLTQPGTSGHSAMNQPSSSWPIRTENVVIRSLLCSSLRPVTPSVTLLQIWFDRHRRFFCEDF